MNGVGNGSGDLSLQRGQTLRCLVASATGPRHEGPLADLTYLAKDLLDTVGRAPTLGLAASDGPQPCEDAAVLRVIDGAGAVRRGFAEMTALACEPSGSNPLRQRPLNPWNPERICGGSSSGSAVAVAAGVVEFAIGSDTAGSLRIPAQCCGVTAWKPTPGLVPIDGAMALAPSLDVLGFLARDAATLRRVADVFGGRKPEAGARTITVAGDLIRDAAPVVAQAVTSLAGHLRTQGCELVERALGPLLAECDPSVMDLLQWETSAQHGWRLANPAVLDAGLQARLRKGQAIDAGAANEARHRLQAIGDASAALRDHDAVLLPVMSMPTPLVAACEPTSPDFSARTLYALSRLTRFANGLGLPVVALPCGFDSAGMPIAAQLVGRPGSDLALLDLAVAVQAATDSHGREPAALKTILESAA